MKPHVFLFLLSVVIIFPTYSQKPAAATQLTSSRGYYKQLERLSPLPDKAGTEFDKQKFPFDKVSAERRLSLKPHYLKNVMLDDFKIPNPPANSSAQTLAELNYLLTLQHQRTELDIQSSLFMAGVFYNLSVTPEDSSYNAYRRNLFFIGRTIGTWFNHDNLPLTADLIANVWRDASYFIWSMKYKYLRVRPYVLEPELDNLEDANWAAYPSGHAANSYINAYLYQELAPEFSDAFIKDAYDMAHSREIIGVHYPSDSEASRIFARQFVNKLFLNEEFLRDFQLVKQEWSEKAKESFIKPSPGISDPVKKPATCGSTTAVKKCE